MIIRQNNLVAFLAIVASVFSPLASGEDAIEWSGRTWQVSDSGDRTRGPGPNIFSSTKESVFVDDSGNLHLKIVQRADGRWSASEVALMESLGYGTYQWELRSRYDGLPSNVVIGLFTYISPQHVAKQTGGLVGDDKPDTPHEIDIEFTGAWGPKNHFFTTHDPDVPSPGVRYVSAPKSDKTTHRFTWSPNKIVWESFDGHVSEGHKKITPLTENRAGQERGDVIRHVYSGPVIPKDLTERPMINFWLFGRDDDQPSVDGPDDGRPQELVIRSFSYTPVLDFVPPQQSLSK